jgi:hypothetical protein
MRAIAAVPVRPHGHRAALELDRGTQPDQQMFIAFFGKGLLLGSTDEWTFKVMRCMADLNSQTQRGTGRPSH